MNILLHIQVERVGVGPDSGVDLDDLRQKLETHKPYNIIGTFSACSNVTGILVDTDQISEIIHQYNGVVIWDYATGGKNYWLLPIVFEGNCVELSLAPTAT